jgi:uncharacterized metal-binding protein YceD (DUF177 family)
MSELKIYVDRLKEGATEKIAEELPPSFLEVEEEALRFEKQVVLIGSAYLASDHLVVELNIKTSASTPCIICNEKIDIPLNVVNFRFTIPLSSIRSGVYDYGQEVREALLLEVPRFVECGGGHCPERETINKYLHKNNMS